MGESPEVWWREMWDCIPMALGLLKDSGQLVAVNETWHEWGLPGSLGAPYEFHHEALRAAVRGKRQKLQWECACGGVEAFAGGEKRQLQLEFVPLPKTKAVLLQICDVSAGVEREKRLLERLGRDELTGLWSRKPLLARLSDLVNQQLLLGGELALCFIDLDRFKETNDTHGHWAGDQILVEVSRRLQTSQPPFALLGRLGGDEFLVAWEHAGEEWQVLAQAESLVRNLSRPVETGGRALAVSASIGVAVFPRDAGSGEDLMRAADLAMLQAKAEGRCGFRRFDQRLQAEQNDRHWIERDLSRSLVEELFWVAYQPQIDLSSNRVVGAEALLRWNHPEGAAVPMSRVIDVAESSGLILPIGYWVIQQAIAQLALWRVIDPALTMSVNLSAVQFNQQDISNDIMQLLEMYETPPQGLKVEITESVVLRRSEKVRNALHSLHAAGVGLHLDDFGTGYSSLSYLQSIPFEAVKIDACFLEGIGKENQDEAIVHAIVKLAQALRISAVAEGVENEVQLRFLERTGCPLGQGFHWAQPMNATEFQAFLLRQ